MNIRKKGSEVGIIGHRKNEKVYKNQNFKKKKGNEKKWDWNC